MSSSFSATKFAGLDLANKFTVAPMTRTSAEPNGRANDLMVDYYGRFADGGFGLIITEGTYTDQFASQGYENQPGISDVPQTEAWEKVVTRVHKAGAKIILQLMHAGAQFQYNRFTDTPVAPSEVKPKGEPLSLYGEQDHWYEPKAMDERDFDQIMNGFVGAAKRAEEAGFDGIELHGANGYLFNQLLSTHFNERKDQWGGSIEHRAAFLLMVVKAVKSSVSEDFSVGVRLSQIAVTDSDYQWPEGETGFQWLVSELKKAGVDFIHTTDNSVNRKALKDSDLSLAEVVRDAEVPLIINGGITEDNYEELAEQYPDALLALGKKALANPDFVHRVKSHKEVEDLDFEMLQPTATIENELKWRDAKAS